MSFKVKQEQGYWRGEFHCMASPCEILIETNEQSLAYSITRIAFEEASRIEKKFSRYRSDNIIYKINS